MFSSFYSEYVADFARAIEAVDETVVEQIADALVSAQVEGRQVVIIGNGGSAASSSHWACDFGKGINTAGSKRLRIVSLTDNVAWMTALGNDLAYDDIFVEQLRNFLAPEDVVIGLSVSGNSENVVRAFGYAKSLGAKVISIVGQREGRMKTLSDIALVIPSDNYGIVEDCHTFIGHVVSQYMKRRNSANEA